MASLAVQAKAGHVLPYQATNGAPLAHDPAGKASPAASRCSSLISPGEKGGQVHDDDKRTGNAVVAVQGICAQ